MSEVHGSKACCTLPPVVADYTEKGEFIEAGEDRAGPSTSKVALVLIYDVFGFGAQILQGADLLAHAGGKHPFQVLIPDFLEGSYADPNWFEPSKATPEMRMAMGKFFGPGGPANPTVMQKKLIEVVEEIKGGGEVEKFGVMGYCWGAKIVSLSTTSGTPFSVGAEVHPSALSPLDAPAITVPLIVLASKDEDVAVVNSFAEALTVPKFVDFYPEAPHGWMTARGDLKDAKGKEDYEKGYKAVADFFHKHLTA